MASFFRPRWRPFPEDDGGGDPDVRSGTGKFARRRISHDVVELAASLPTSVSDSGEVGSPRWLSGLISGAGKLISSVFLSSSSEYEEESEEEEEEEEEELNSNETMKQSKAIVITSESKLAIEQLLLNETFSRDECDKMIQLIQSRVVESPSAQGGDYGTPRESASRTTGSARDFTGAWRSMNQNRNSVEPVPFFGHRFNGFSAGSPFQTSPEICNAAIMEAKKWLEEKKQASKSKTQDLGRCTLNTDMLHYNSADEGSPVDLAKSYMQLLPPWKSPLLGITGFKTPLSCFGMNQQYKDEMAHGTFNYSFSSSRVLEREYLSQADTLEESQRACLRSDLPPIDFSKFKKSGSGTRLSDIKTSKILFPTHAKGQVHTGANINASSSQVLETTGAATKLSSSEEAAPGIQTTYGSFLLTTIPTETMLTKPGNGHQAAGPDALAQDGSDGIEILRSGKEDRGNSACEPHILSKPYAGGASCKEVWASETINSTRLVVWASETINSTRITNAVANNEDKNAETVVPDREVHSSSHLNTASDLRNRDGGPQVKSSTNGPINGNSANGIQDRSNANSGLESSNDNPSCTNSSSAVPLADSNEILSDPAADVIGTTTTQNGTKMKSVERMLNEPQPAYVRRGRKRVVKGMRGRGK